jgi:hypothetical protein
MIDRNMSGSNKAPIVNIEFGRGKAERLGSEITGWCLDQSATQAPLVEILIADICVATLQPTLMRADRQGEIRSHVPTGFAFELDKIHPRICEQILRSSKSEFPVRASDRRSRSDLTPSTRIVGRTLLESWRYAPAIASRDSQEYVGCFEGLFGTILSGWALSQLDPMSNVAVDVYKDFVYLGTRLCDRDRADVTAIFGSKSACGFQIDVRDFGLELNELVSFTHFDIRISGTNYFLQELDRKQDIATPSTRPAVGVDHAVTIIANHGLSRRAGAPKTALALYAIHTEIATLSTFHVAVMRELERLGFYVVVINSFEGNSDSLGTQLDDLADEFVVRVDLGRDFGSWVSYVMTYYDFVSCFEHVAFLNDSLLGPLFPLEQVFERGLNSDAALWALTDSYQQLYHLQSSFVLVRSDAWKNNSFRQFFSEYQYPTDKTLIIQQGEIGLSSAARRGGILLGAMCPYTDVARLWLKSYSDDMQYYAKIPEAVFPFLSAQSGHVSRGFSDHTRIWYSNIAADIRTHVPRNPQHAFWNTLIKEFRYPFLKKELVVLNPEGVPNLSLLYDVAKDGDTKVLAKCIHEALLMTPGRAPPICALPDA